MAATKQKKKKAAKATELVHMAFIIDESGSMSGKERSVVDGYNEFVAGLRDESNAGDVRVTVGMFDSHGGDPKVRYKYEGEELPAAPEMAYQDYRPRGMTPLNDAVAEAIGRVSKAQGKGDRAMLVIMTDGLENASELSTEDLRKLVQKKEKDGWEFIYIGANVDAFDESSKLGMSGKAGSYFNFTSSPVGTSNAMRMAGSRGAHYLGAQSTYDAVGAMTSDSIAEDPAAAEAQLAAAKKARDDAEAAEREASAQAKEERADALGRAKGLLGNDEE